MLLFRICAEGDVSGGMVRRFTVAIRNALAIEHAGMGA